MRTTELRKKLAILKVDCAGLRLTLMSNKTNYLPPSAICVLSICEFDIGQKATQCDREIESYFLSSKHHEIYINR